MGFIYTARAAPKGGHGTLLIHERMQHERMGGSETLPLKSIPTHGAAGRAGIAFGVAVDTCQVNGRPAGHLTLMVGLGVVSTNGHPLKSTGGEVGSGDVTHGVRSIALIL